MKTAILYGADAVYLGTPDMSLRTKSGFSLSDVMEGITFARQRGVRVYLTLNLFSHNKDIHKLPQFVETIRSVGPDAVIVADPGVFMFVQKAAPEIPLHVSTQANVCSWQSVKFWEDQGAELCVLGREVSFAELAEIRERCPNIKLEAFVHGSMCMTYSGRCLLSNYMAERGANQGACANSCRWKYNVHMRLKDGSIKELPLSEENLELFEFLLEEEVRPGDLMPIEEDDRGSYILNSRDLCIMPRLSDYLRIGIDSLKVEGRGKSPFYAGLVARAYRRAIDDWYRDPDGWSPESYMRELLAVPNRGYSLAFHEGRLTHHSHGYEHTATLSEYEYAGIVREVTDDAFIVDAKNRLDAGDVVEFMPPHSERTILLRLYDFELAETGERVDHVNAGHISRLRLPFSLFHREHPADLKRAIVPFTILRKEKTLRQEEWDRLLLDKAVVAHEASKRGEGLIQLRTDKLRASIDERDKHARPRTRRSGVEGCCGKGCNGCLVFWHDESYRSARELLEQKAPGELLSKREAARPRA